MARVFVSDALADGFAAGGFAALLSGAPSTLHAFVVGASPLEATLAAGTLVLPCERRLLPLLLAAVPAHAAISLGWGVVLALVLPARRTVGAGAVAGLAIAALDLGVVARRFPASALCLCGPRSPTMSSTDWWSVRSSPVGERLAARSTRTVSRSVPMARTTAALKRRPIRLWRSRGSSSGST